jgi:hypothetical protein
MSTEPKRWSNTFQCPHCRTVAKQDWFQNHMLSERIVSIYKHNFFDYRSRIEDYKQDAIRQFLTDIEPLFPTQINYMLPDKLSIARCHACGESTLWINDDLVYPKTTAIDLPSLDMDIDIQNLYNEASSIVLDSPKGASALLRLALQKLLVQLGEKGKDINSDIASLVSKGLSPKIQQALDFVRVVGNESVHPGTIDLDDNMDIAISLFKLLNFITEEMITKPKEIESLYENILPQSKRDAIEKRDTKK